MGAQGPWPSTTAWSSFPALLLHTQELQSCSSRRSLTKVSEKEVRCDFFPNKQLPKHKHLLKYLLSRLDEPIEVDFIEIVVKEIH